MYRKFNAGLTISTEFPSFDFETYSPAGFVWNEKTCKYEAPYGAKDKGLPVTGVAVYSEHPECEVLSMAYDLKDGRGVQLWIPKLGLPKHLINHVLTGGVLEAWNSMFEHWIWNNVCCTKYGFPPLPLHQLRCAKAKAQAFSLPPSLEKAGDALNINNKKDKDGKRLLNLFSIPRNPTKNDNRKRITPDEEPEEAQKLYDYNRRDVEAEDEIARICPDLIPQELEFWYYSQVINYRGVQIDLDAIYNCVAIVDAAHKKYNAELSILTEGQVNSASEIQRLTSWVNSQGVMIESLTKEVVDELLKQPFRLTPKVKRALEIRQLIGLASVKKLYAMLNQVTSKGRLHDLFIYHSARTGRAAGTGPQPQNLPNSGPSVYVCSHCSRHYVAPQCTWCGGIRASDNQPTEWNHLAVIDALETISTKSLGWVEHHWGDALATISACLRGMFIAAPGHDLICSDYSAIEAVVLAMLSGEQWREDVFRTHGKIYEMSASKISGTSFDDIVSYPKFNDGKKHPLRALGKVAELACFSHDTQVLTQRGYVPIVDVLLQDKLWDGVEWVNHEGVVPKGVKNTIVVDGVRMTPEHPVSLKHSWVEAKQLDSNDGMLTLALAIGSENLPTSESMGDPLKETDLADVNAIEKSEIYKKESKNLSYVYDIVNAGPRHRFTIKTNSGHLIVHNSGYQGWVGGWTAFGADEFLNEQEIKEAILAWRAASPAIVNFWGGQKPSYFGLEGAAIQAVLNPGIKFTYRAISYISHANVLYCELPSGRHIVYHRPQVTHSERRPGTFSLSYEGWNTNQKYGTAGWMRIETWGGRLVENVVQGVARDILAHAIVNLEKAGYRIVLHVHDEIVAEVPENFGSIEEFERIMSTLPKWAEGWPVVAKGGWRDKRYRK